MVWSSCYAPASWRRSIIIPILKPNKVRTEGILYILIALTSNMCKLMQHMIVMIPNGTWSGRKHSIGSGNEIINLFVSNEIENIVAKWQIWWREEAYGRFFYSFQLAVSFRMSCPHKIEPSRQRLLNWGLVTVYYINYLCNDCHQVNWHVFAQMHFIYYLCMYM